jgi:hypothetical protein
MDLARTLVGMPEVGMRNYGISSLTLCMIRTGITRIAGIGDSVCASLAARA